jgi:hypothetical protein
MPAVEYAPSINMSNWLLSTSGLMRTDGAAKFQQSLFQ